MKFKNHVELTLNRLGGYSTRYLQGNDRIYLAFVAVESYLRPLKIRVAEYTCVLLGFDLTVGLCQIRYSFWRFPDEESFLTRVLKMENVESCTEAVKLYFNVHGGLPSNLSEAVRSYTGADYIYYTCLLEEALQIIYARSVQVVKLCLNSTSSSY